MGPNHFRSPLLLTALSTLVVHLACNDSKKDTSAKSVKGGTLVVGDGKGGNNENPIEGGGDPGPAGGTGTLLIGAVAAGFNLSGAEAQPDKVCGQMTNDAWNSHPAYCVDIAADGSFQIPVACGKSNESTSHCVFLLVDSTLPRKDRVLGFVSLNAQNEAGDTLLMFDASQVSKNVNLGLLNPSNDEAVSTATLTETEDSFKVSKATLILQARADNMLKNAKNMFINTRQAFDTEGEDYVLTQRFYWKQKRLDDMWIGGTSADDVKFAGYALQGSTYDADFRVDRVRENLGSTQVALVPPAPVQAFDYDECEQNPSCSKKTYNASDGLKLKTTDPIFNGCYSGGDHSLCLGHFDDMQLACQTSDTATPPSSTAACIRHWDFEPGPRAMLGFGGSGEFQDRVSGFWKLVFGGASRAWWDLDLAFPTSDFSGSTRTTIPLPIISGEKDSDGRVTKIVVTWKMVNPANGQYETVEDGDFLRRFFDEKVMLGFSGTGTGLCKEAYFRTPNHWKVENFARMELTTFTRDTTTPDQPFSDKWYAGTPPAGADNCPLNGVQIGFGLDGSDASFWFRR